jgi:hypothetical protein
MFFVKGKKSPTPSDVVTEYTQWFSTDVGTRVKNPITAISAGHAIISKFCHRQARSVEKIVHLINILSGSSNRGTFVFGCAISNDGNRLVVMDPGGFLILYELAMITESAINDALRLDEITQFMIAAREVRMHLPKLGTSSSPTTYAVGFENEVRSGDVGGDSFGAYQFQIPTLIEQLGIEKNFGVRNFVMKEALNLPNGIYTLALQNLLSDIGSSITGGKVYLSPKTSVHHIDRSDVALNDCVLFKWMIEAHHLITRGYKMGTRLRKPPMTVQRLTFSRPDRAAVIFNRDMSLSELTDIMVMGWNTSNISIATGGRLLTSKLLSRTGDAFSKYVSRLIDAYNQERSSDIFKSTNRLTIGKRNLQQVDARHETLVPLVINIDQTREKDFDRPRPVEPRADLIEKILGVEVAYQLISIADSAAAEITDLTYNLASKTTSDIIGADKTAQKQTESERFGLSLEITNILNFE